MAENVNVHRRKFFPRRYIALAAIVKFRMGNPKYGSE